MPNKINYILSRIILYINKYIFMDSFELLWPSGYELQLSLKRLWVLIQVKVIGG